MKSLITTTLVGAFISASAAAATGWQTDFEAARKLASKEKKDLLLDLTGSDWKQGFLYDRPGSALFFLITQDEGQEPKKKKAVEQGKKEDKGPDEGTLRKALAKTRKQVEIVQKKIEGDHALWTRSGEQMKESRERLAELAALLAFSADRNNDKVGLILFTEEIEQYLPPAKGQQHVLRILREILFREAQGKGTNLRGSLRFLNRVMRRRAVVFLLSDFLIPNNGDEDESAEDILLKELFTTRRRHDLICARVSDPRENDLPDVGRIVLEDAETGEFLEVNTSDTAFRQRYTESNKARIQEFEQRLLRRGIDHFGFSTDTDYVNRLREFFKIRENRRRG